MKLELERWGLPTDRPLRYADLKRAGIIGSYAHFQGLLDAGRLPPGTWLSPSFRFWHCVEIAQMLLNLPKERPPCAVKREEEALACASKANCVSAASSKSPPKACGESGNGEGARRKKPADDRDSQSRKSSGRT
jgi:hypothetical protein